MDLFTIFFYLVYIVEVVSLSLNITSAVKVICKIILSPLHFYSVLIQKTLLFSKKKKKT